MEYQVTARKWRPQTFVDVIGQEHLVRALQNALSEGKIPHAYLFSGARGVGKTTTARILAKSLNCPNRKGAEPCNVCHSCVEITGGHSLDVMEIDGASNRGIDSIREITSNINYMPLSAKYKIYIIDEVHMLTNEASNALLKTLEEPPEHAIFVLATTEPQKVLPTIRSRCQHYIFKKIPVRTIMATLSKIAKTDGIQCDDEGLFLIAQAADGSMRDSESLFDQVAIYSGGKINEQTVAEVIGLPEDSYYIDIVTSLKAQDPIAMLRVFNRYLENVGDIKIFVKGLIQFFRTGLLSQNLNAEDELLDLTPAKYKQLKELFHDFKAVELSRILRELSDLYKDLKGDQNERFLTELALFKILDYKNLVEISEIHRDVLALLNRGGMPVQPPQNVAQPQPKRASTPPEPSVSYQKLNIPAQGKASHSAVSATHMGGISAESFPNILAQCLSGNPLLRSLANQVKSVEIKGDTVNVWMNTAHACEYLSGNLEDIQNKMEQAIGKRYILNFLFQNQACVSPAPINETKPIANTTKPAEAAIEPNLTLKRETSPAPQTEKKSEKPEEKPTGTVSAIKDLFDAK